MAEELPLILGDGTNSYIYGPGGLPIEQISSGGTVTYLHHDQQGSTRLLTGSTGTVTGKCTYGAYGTSTCEGATTTPLVGYDAQYTSSDTGLIYPRARVYDPATAQFITVDPIANLTRAPYYYAGDNPLNFSDPTGLSCSINPIASNNCFSEVPNAIGGAVVSGAEWAYEHPGQAAEATAAGACVVATDGVCAGFVGGALGVNTYINTEHPDFLGHEAVAVGETLLLGGAGLVKTGLGATGLLDGALPETWLGNAALNSLLTWPAGVGIALEGQIIRAIFCE
jgi:RHS repeat-associated protein